jgi:hypothetical protein
MAASSEPPDWACIIHRRTNELLTKQYTISYGQATLFIETGPSTPSPLAALYPTRLMCAHKVSCVSRVTLRCHAVLTHYFLSKQLDWPGLLDASCSLS